MFTLRENQVLVGIDGSESSTEAALWAGAEAERRNAALRVMHAYSTPLTGFSGPGMIPPSLYDANRDHARKVLGQTRDIVLAAFPELEVTTQLRQGSPAAELRSASEHVLLTVVGSHGSHQFTESVLGSVASRVAGHAHGPVVVIRTDPKSGLVGGDGRIVVGLDGSADSDDALAFAFEEAALRGTSLVAIHTWNDAALDGYLRTYPLDVDRGQIDDVEYRQLAEQLAGWSEKYPDVAVQPLILRGRSTQALVNYCHRADQRPSMLVVGCRGRGGFAELVMGSTSHGAIAHAPCPVAVVRGPRTG